MCLYHIRHVNGKEKRTNLCTHTDSKTVEMSKKKKKLNKKQERHILDSNPCISVLQTKNKTREETNNKTPAEQESNEACEKDKKSPHINTLKEEIDVKMHCIHITCKKKICCQCRCSVARSFKHTNGTPYKK